MLENYLLLKIIEIIRETEDTASFILQPLPGKTLPYKPGQFIILVFNLNGREVRRSYSLSSTAGVNDFLRITVKRVHNGEVSRLLLDHYKPGDSLQALPPAGLFVLPGGLKKNSTIFLIAAGSGIAPVFSLLQQLLYHTNTARVILLYQNHSVGSTIFRAELKALCEKFTDRLLWLDFVTTGGHNFKKITNDRLEQLVREHNPPGYSEVLFYICGPASFMRMCQFTIRLLGFSESQIRREFFVIETVPPAPSLPHPGPHRVTVHLGDRQFVFETAYPFSILKSALANNIALPYSCNGGRCSACTAFCVRGQVVMSTNDVLTAADLSRGLVLTCVGYADSDIELNYDQHEPGPG